jgi:hypothetical protein
MKSLLILLCLGLAGCQTAAPLPLPPMPAKPAPEFRPVVAAPPAPLNPALEQKVRQQAQYIEALISQNEALSSRLTAAAAPTPAVANPVPEPAPVAIAPPPAPPLQPIPVEPMLTPNADGVIDLAAVAADAGSGEAVNPFAVRAAPAGAGREVTLHVSGILAGKTPCAVINDRLVQTAETVESFTVERIEPDAVWLRYAGQRLRLPVSEKPARVRLPL